MLQRCGAIVGFVILLGFTTPAPAAKAAPLARTQALLETFRDVQSGAAAQAQNAPVYQRIDDFFDYNTLTSGPIAAHVKKMTPAQLKQFTSNFRELIRLAAYPRSGDFIRKATVSLSAGVVTGKSGVVDMDAKVPAEDIETHVTFHWKDMGDAWRIVDITFDGSSVVQDYQNQFSRIVKKDGIAGLLKKIDDKLAERRKNL